MELSDRQIDILSKINSDGRVDVDQLAIDYTVTTQTIRRDLNELCTRVLPRESMVEPYLLSLSRMLTTNNAGSLHRTKKNRSARRRATDTQPLFGHSEHWDHDRTGREGSYEHKSLVVITNNVNVISTLTAHHKKIWCLLGEQSVKAMGRLLARTPSNLSHDIRLILRVSGPALSMKMELFSTLTPERSRLLGRC